MICFWKAKSMNVKKNNNNKKYMKNWHTYKALNTTEKNKNSKNEKVTSKNFYLSGN